ncbi:MAG: phosphoethanolamine transferase domain-containing protein, partial [Pseudomonadota bacterium]
MRQVKLAFSLALAYYLLFNSSNILFKFEYYKADIWPGILELAKDSVYILVANFIIFFGLSCNRLLVSIGAIFLFVSGAIGSYSLYFFRAHPTKHMLHTMLENEFLESYEVISIKAIIWVIFSAIVCIIILFRYARHKLKARILTTTCLIIFASNIYSPHYKILNSYFPIQYLHNTYLYLSERFKVIHKLDISEKFDWTSK